MPVLDYAQRCARIISARIETVTIDGDRVTCVYVTLPGNVELLLFTLPAGHVYLEEHDFVGRTCAGAEDQVECWLGAQVGGTFRIVDVEFRRIGADGPSGHHMNGDSEAIALLSNGEITQLFAFESDQMLFDPFEFIDHSPRQALTVLSARKAAASPGSYAPDLRSAYGCLLCDQLH